MGPTRRQMLKWGLGAGLTAGAVGAGGVGAILLSRPRPSEVLAPWRELSVSLHDALDEGERARVVLPYDHPLRQYHNRGVDTGGGWLFQLRRATQQRVVDLVYSALSERGRSHIPAQLVLDWTGLYPTRLAICGSPHDAFCQILVTGPHLNLRLGGRSREGVAFGGPQVYGDQRGNDKLGLPGNIYRDQLELGQALFAGMTPRERSAARQPKAPVQTGVQLQGAAGVFEGVPVAELGAASRGRARDFATAILANYPEEDAAYAWQCIEHNGGLDALFAADYDLDHQGGQSFAGVPSQIFRLEGPAAVLHYRGTPHLHALLNIGMDGERPLSVGEVVGENPRRLDKAGVKALFETILLEETGAVLAYYSEEAVAGRLQAGTIRTGDLYSLESWRDRVAVVEIEGADLGPALVSALRVRGDAVQPRHTYPVATTAFIADYLGEELGRVASRTDGAMLRDVAIAHLRTRGFPGSA